MRIWHSEGAGAKPLAELLARAAGEDDPSRVLADLNQGLTSVATDESAPVIFLIEPPVESICASLRQGIPPAEALQGWTRQTNEILDFQRRNRSRTRIMDMAMIAMLPARFAEVEKLATADVVAALSQRENLRETEPVLYLIAHQTLQSDLTARELVGELEAVSLYLSDDAELPEPETDMIFRRFREAGSGDSAHLQAELSKLRHQLEAQISAFEAQGKKLKKKLKKSRKEAKDLERARDFAITELQRLKESGLEYSRAEYQALVEENDKLKTALGAQEDQLAALIEEAKALHQQKQRLEQRIAQLNHGMDSFQEQLGDLGAELRQKREELVEKTARIAELEAENERILNSFSMRITEPLRRLRRAFGR